jgi:hypothetical protein
VILASKDEGEGVKLENGRVLSRPALSCSHYPVPKLYLIRLSRDGGGTSNNSKSLGQKYKSGDKEFVLTVEYTRLQALQ